MSRIASGVSVENHCQYDDAEQQHTGWNWSQKEGEYHAAEKGKIENEHRRLRVKSVHNINRPIRETGKLHFSMQIIERRRQQRQRHDGSACTATLATSRMASMRTFKNEHLPALPNNT